MPVYFIGAGAGDPELMTVKGKKVLGKADTVIYAGSLVNPDVLDYAPEAARTFNSAEMNLEEIMDRAISPAKEGKVVARVHTGDPSIYGSLQEQIEFLENRGIDYEVIPGVSSLVAASAAVGREYTLPDVSQTVIVTRLEGRTPVPEEESLEKLAVHQASMAIFLSVHMIGRVVEELEAGYGDDTPVAVVEKASWPEEKVIKGRLKNISRKVEEAGIEKTALILVGDFLDTQFSQSKLYDKTYSHDYRKGKQEKKAILVTSFGTTHEETRKKTIKACENKIAESFENFEVRRAFTSGMIIDRLEKRDGIHVDDPEQALENLREQGYSSVVVQPLHLIPGSEFHELAGCVRKRRYDFNRVELGKPLMRSSNDYKRIAKILGSQYRNLGPDEALVLMGHGSNHPANSVYPALDYVFKDLEMANFFAGTVEGYPGIEEVKDQLKGKDIERLHLAPLMLVAGDHAKNDMAGSDDGSWESVLTGAGYEVETHLKGLGEYEKVQETYVRKVEKALDRS